MESGESEKESNLITLYIIMVKYAAVELGGMTIRAAIAEDTPENITDRKLVSAVIFAVRVCSFFCQQFGGKETCYRLTVTVFCYGSHVRDVWCGTLLHRWSVYNHSSDYSF